MTKKVISRYFAPTRLDHAPVGTIFKLINEDESNKLYIQLSTDIEHPDWQELSRVLEVVFEEEFENEDFINNCIKKYNLIQKL